MNRLLAALLAATSFGIIGCATGPAATSPAEVAYLDGIMKEAVEFDIPKEQGDDAMGRAQVFIAKYGSMKIQTATNNVVDTYNVPQSNVLMPQSYGYKVLRANIGDKAHITIECFNGLEDAIISSAHAMPARNARFLARYMHTGAIEHPELIAK